MGLLEDLSLSGLPVGEEHPRRAAGLVLKPRGGEGRGVRALRELPTTLTRIGSASPPGRGRGCEDFAPPGGGGGWDHPAGGRAAQSPRAGSIWALCFVKVDGEVHMCRRYSPNHGQGHVGGLLAQKGGRCYRSS